MKDDNELAFLKTLGKKLQAKRRAKKISQATLSYDANIPKSQIGRIERGEINTTVLTLFKICNALEIDMRDLLT
jgi:transcriptional regulator with XRE-family HTH domain